MKKIYLLLCSAFITTASIAQSQGQSALIKATESDAEFFSKKAEHFEAINEKSTQNKANPSFWMYYQGDYSNFFSTTPSLWRGIMWPDSNITATFDGTSYFNPFLHSVAQEFHVSTPIYDAELANWDNSQSFIVDSIQITSTYERPDIISIDTLLVQVVDLLAHTSFYSWFDAGSQPSNDYGSGHTVFFNQIKHDTLTNFRVNTGVVYSQRIILDQAYYADSNANGSQTIRLQANTTIPNTSGHFMFNNRFAVTVDYLPGITSWDQNDTLLTQQNVWQPFHWELEGSGAAFVYLKTDQNQAFYVNGQSRYNKVNSNGWYGQYLPSVGAGVGGSIEAHEISVKVKQDNTVGLEELTNNVEFSVYPNPSNGVFNVKLNTESTENVTLSVKNIVGQTVLTNNINVAGYSRETISLENQSNGIYFLTIENNNVSKTVKLVKE